jgi:ABC-type multidrug transport system fused ATPase/permease subunit
VEDLSAEKYTRSIWIAVLFCAVTLLLSALTSTGEFERDRIARAFNHRLAVDLTRHAAMIPYAQFERFEVREKHKFAEKCAKENSAGKILSYFAESASAALSLVGLFYLSSHLVWWLWLVLVAGIAVNVLCEAYRKKIDFSSAKEQNPVDMCMLYSRDRLTWKSFAKEVRLFSMYEYVRKKAEHYIGLLSAIQTRNAVKTVRVLAWSYLFNGLWMIAVYGYIAYRCFTGELSVANFTMLTLSMLSISELTENIAAKFISIRQQVKYWEEYRAFLAIPEEREEGMAPDLSRPFEIVFDHVSFTYPGAEKRALSDVTAVFRSGLRYGIVGANGSGKTTFVHLLMGLYSRRKGKYPSATSLWKRWAGTDLSCFPRSCRTFEYMRIPSATISLWGIRPALLWSN